MSNPLRLAVVASHPVQYQAPLFRELAGRLDLQVFFACRPTPAQQGAGFDVAFQWDSDLLSGYQHAFLANVASHPDPSRFSGCDTPELGRALVAGRFDAVLVMGWHLKSFWQAAFACLRRGVPVMVRGDSQLGAPRSVALRVAKSIAYPPALRLFSACLYVGERSRAYYRRYGVPDHRLFFAPHAIDEAWFRSRATNEARQKLRGRLGLTDADQLLLFAGKLVDFKRPVDVVRAAALLRKGGEAAVVGVAGDGPLAGDLRRVADELAVPLRMLGFLNQTEMPCAYAAADVLVLPSDGRETWGLVANEALACGAPILVSDAVGCAPDLAGDGVVGSIFPTGDIEALARSVLQLSGSRAARVAMEARLRQYGVGASADGIVAAAVSCANRADKRCESAASSPKAA